MGTKVQGKSYYPGYYSMRNLNNGADSGSWSLYPEDSHLRNGIYYNSYLPRPAIDGFVEYDKEVLKKTILKHDAIFRNQVFELHRLYRIQMDLMHQFKRKELGKCPMLVEASQSSPVSSLMPFDDVQRLWHLPPVNSSCTRVSAHGTVDMVSASGFIVVNGMQVSPVSIQKGSSSKDCELLGSKSQKRPRRMLDLQLPADEYIDCEEVKVVEKEKVAMPSYKESNGLKRSPGNPTETDVKLFLGSGMRPGLGEHTSKPDLCTENKHKFADLNEPIQIEEMADSVPANFLGPGNRKIQGKDMPGKPNSAFLGLPCGMFQNTLKGETNGAHVSTLQLEKEGNGREWLSNNLGAGQSKICLNSFPQGFRPDNLHAPSELMQVELRKDHPPPEYSPDNHIKREPWSVSATCGIDSSKRNQNSNHSTSGYFATPCRQPSHSVLPQSDVTSCGSSVDPSWMTPLSSFNQKAIAVQALPCFDTSSKSRSKTPYQKPGTMAENGHLHSLSKSKSSYGNEASTQNGYSHWPLSESNTPQVHFPSVSHDCLNYGGGSTSVSESYQCSTMYLKSSNRRDVKSLEGLNLNLSFPNVTLQKIAQQQDDVVIIDREGEKEDPSKVIHWLRPTIKEKGHSNKMGLSFLQNCSQNIETKELPTPSSVQDFISVSCSYDAESERPEVGECPSNKKIIGVPLFGKFLSIDSSSHSSPKSLDFPSEPETVQDTSKAQVLDIDLSRDLATSDSCQPQLTRNEIVEKDMDKDISVGRNDFNLNLSVDEEEMLSATSSMGTPCKIDLEAPVVPEATEGVTPVSQSPENQQVTPIHSSQNDADTEELNRLAAEAIVLISSSSPVYNTLEEATCPTSVASLWDSLNWFSGVLSNMNDLDSKVEVVSIGKDEGGHEESSFDGIDYFESMTLKLTETKEDEYWCTKPWAFDSPNEEEKSTSVLLTRRRRGQGRRGRQRRDFQRDILPGLVSLSRHEVTEDLQLIGGLMRATGYSWQTGSSRRNAARNGCARGRRRTQGPVSPVTPVPVSPPRQQFINIEVGVQDQSLKGWGKTTRRPRRQRYAAGNPPIPVTQA